jgi:hypothetical protein
VSEVHLAQLEQGSCIGADVTSDLIHLLRATGCTLVRHGKGDQDIWESPISGRRFTGDAKIRSRHMASILLKQADLPQML